MKFGKKQLVLASLVLALGAAVYLNWQFAGTNRLPVEDSASEASQLGAAQLVNNAYVETVTDDLPVGRFRPNHRGRRAFSGRIDRQTSRDEAMDLIDSVLESVIPTAPPNSRRWRRPRPLPKNILEESNVESLLEAKGYSDCVAYITPEECSVVIAGTVEEADTLIVQRSSWSKLVLLRIK